MSTDEGRGADGGPEGSSLTFTQSARRAQLIACTINALVEVGYQRTTVAEIAQRAGVSKGVVSYHFAARDELIWSVLAEVFDSIGEHVGGALAGTDPGAFVAGYINAWVGYYREHRREMAAVAEIWTNFRDSAGRPHLDARTLGKERAMVEAALAAGQAAGYLGSFDTRVMAVTLKAALDGLLGQLAIEPDLDLEVYRRELVALFDRATAAERPRASTDRLMRASTDTGAINRRRGDSVPGSGRGYSNGTPE